MSKPTTFTDVLRIAEQDFWTDFQRATSFAHHGDIGTAREKILANFLRKQLPGRYHVESGEAIDQFGVQSGQIDLMVYDGLTTAPLSGAEGVNVLLPVEALLATIEVKTKLTKTEIKKSVAGIKSQYELSPWGDPWARTRDRGDSANDKMPRLFTTIFGYNTNIGKKDWALKEIERIREQARLEEFALENLNTVVVLNRGLLRPFKGEAAETSDSKGILSHWFFTLINFLDREVERRRAFPWSSYESPGQIDFTNIVPQLEHADSPILRTKSMKNRLRKRAAGL